MKITFSNLGSIKKTTLDLRPLTVIIGPNNSNKTYIAYSIYGMWKYINQIPISPIDINKVEKKSSTYSIKINNELIDILIKDIQDILGSFSQNLSIFFQDTSKKLFNKTNYEIELSRQEIKQAISNLTKYPHELLNGSFRMRLEKNILYADLPKNINQNEKKNFEMSFAFSIVGEIRKHFCPFPFLLPAERNAFILTYKILENRRYNLLKNRIFPIFEDIDVIQVLPTRQNVGYSAYPQPIEDFLEFLREIELETNFDTGTPQKHPNLCELADKIESSIQNKNRTTFLPSKLGGKELKVNIKDGLDIDLYNASSSIKQLAPLLLYLRYRARENDLLIIDEPEMNLHPESQAKLLEVLGMLVNAGVNVLLTTHSPYFMSHLNNLVSGKTDDESVLKEQAKSLYLGDERAFLKMEDVSAYEMKNNKLKDLKDKDYGIRWDTLSDVSADIQQKFFEIYEKGDTPTNGEKE